MPDSLLTSATVIYTFLTRFPTPPPLHWGTEPTPSRGLPPSLPPWHLPQGNHDEVARSLCHWLACLGWSAAGTEDVHPATRWLFFHAGKARLSALVVAPTLSLDVTLNGEHSLDSSPEAVAKRHWLTRGEKFGVLTNGRELRFFLFDDDCQWHTVIASGCFLGDSPRFRLAPLDPRQTLEMLCGSGFLQSLGPFTQELCDHKRQRLEELRGSIRLGLSSFLSELLATPNETQRPESHLRSPEFAEAVWHEGLLLAYATLFVTRAEMIVQQRPSNGLFSSPDWVERYSPLHALIPRLAATEAEHELTSSGFAFCFKEMLLRVATIAQPGDPSLFHVAEQEPLEFPELRQFSWTDSACIHFLEALLLEPTSRDDPRRTAHQRRRSLDTLSVQDIAHLFEAFLDYTPALAPVPMARYRRGKREVVLPLATPSIVAERNTAQLQGTAQATALKPVETIAAGRFYVTETKGRKTSGAFYTPTAIVEAVTTQALHRKLACSPLDDWASVLCVSVLDPAMGTGAFLLEASAQLGKALFERIVHCVNRKQPFSETRTTSPSTAAPASPSTLPAPLLRDITEWVAAAAECQDQADPSALAFPSDALFQCIALCTQHCLFGVDQNALSTRIAKMALWSACGCSTTVARSLSKHLVTGNALTGPRLGDFFAHPQSGEPLPLPLRDPISLRCAEYLAHHQALGSRPSLHSSPLLHSRSTDHDAEHLALLHYARTWTDAAGLGPQTAGNPTADFFQLLATCDRRKLPRLGRDTNGLCFELAFPERFHFDGQCATGGFDVILGNPPWDSVKHNTREVLANLDLRTASIATKPERDALTQELHDQGRLANALTDQIADYERTKRIHDRLYHHQKIVIDGDLAGRQLDLFRLFLERSWGLLVPGGILGMVVPSAFHTAAGAAGVRRLIFSESTRVTYAVLRNERHWFDISPGLEFGLLTAQEGSNAAGALDFRFDLTGPESLLHDNTEWLSLPLQHFIDSNPYATIPAISSREELELVCTAERSGVRLMDFMNASRVELRSTPTSVHRTHEAKHFVQARTGGDPRQSLPTTQQLLAEGALLHEGATFTRYDDTWGPPPVYALSPARLLQVSRWRSAVGYYRVVVRAIVGASPHKSIAALIAPGTLAANSALVEGQPQARPNYQALVTLAVLNSSTANYLLSTSADLNVNLFALRRLPWPKRLPERFLAHTALRLVTNHPGFLPLWEEQLGKDLASLAHSALPMVPEPAERLALQGVLDAVVAKAYGITRSQYHLVLSHWGDAPAYQAGKSVFDQLEAEGEDAVLERHDPFLSNSLVESLPQPLLTP